MSVVQRNPALDHRDIRSATLPFKRDKDHVEKWSHGIRPSPGVRYDMYNPDEISSGSESQKQKIRPHKPGTLTSNEPKNHANKSTKPFGNFSQGCTSSKIDARQVKKVDALIDANDHTSSPLSKSLLELLPRHADNTQSAIHTAIRESAAATDAEILYSFDNKGPSPGQRGRDVDLGGLVEIAEQKWASEQIDRIVKGEYEMLDNQGETIVTRGKGKRSPKQKATKPTAPVMAKIMDVEEDDSFVLI